MQFHCASSAALIEGDRLTCFAAHPAMCVCLDACCSPSITLEFGRRTICQRTILVCTIGKRCFDQPSWSSYNLSPVSQAGQPACESLPTTDTCVFPLFFSNSKGFQLEFFCVRLISCFLFVHDPAPVLLVYWIWTFFVSTLSGQAHSFSHSDYRKRPIEFLLIF